MTTLAANKVRQYGVGEIEEYPVIASDSIFEGAAVGEDASGYARPLVAADPFLGFAEGPALNESGGVGAVNVRVRTRGRVTLSVTGASAITANDRPIVYASDDDTFTLSANTNTPIGRVSRWISGTLCVVEFDALYSAERVAVVAALALKANVS
jgi:hypothetical protein